MREKRPGTENKTPAPPACFTSPDMRDRLQAMFRVEESRDDRFYDVLERLDAAVAKRRESCAGT